MIKSASAAAFFLALSITGSAAAQTSLSQSPASQSPASTPRFEPPPRPNHTNDMYDIGLSQFFRSPNLAYLDTYNRMVGYGRCASNVAPKYAERFLISDPGDPDGRAAARRLVGLSKGCLPLGSYVPIDFLRLGLAEAGYRRALATGMALPQPTVVPMRAYDKSPFALAAACLASRAPGETNKVMSTAPGSAAERDALINAFATTPQCGRIGQATLRELPALRAHIAVAAYRSLRRL